MIGNAELMERLRCMSPRLDMLDCENVLTAADRIGELIAERDAANALLEAWVEVAEHCSIEEGVCCCGDNMNGHSHPMSCGHSPVDHGAYIASQLEKTTRTHLGAKP